MTRLLRIDAGARINGSHSRRLADYYQHRWNVANPGGKIRHRDLAMSPVPHLTNEEIVAFQDKSGACLSERKLSDILCGEICWADQVLITSPLYNYSMPSTLKAWLDHISRPGYTFEVKEGSYHGLLRNLAVTVITSRGSLSNPARQDDFQSDYLKALFGMLGTEKVDVINIEGTALPALQNRKYFLAAKKQVAYKFNSPVEVQFVEKAHAPSSIMP